VRINIFNVTHVSTTEHKFTCDLFVEASWEEPALIGQRQRYDAGELTFSTHNIEGSLWHPRLVLMNQLEAADFEEWFTVYWALKGVHFPKVVYRSRAKVTFSKKFELLDFPFDAQDLSILISSNYHFKRPGELTCSVCGESLKHPATADAVGLVSTSRAAVTAGFFCSSPSTALPSLTAKIPLSATSMFSHPAWCPTLPSQGNIVRPARFSILCCSTL
jgi:hypothetical protein